MDEEILEVRFALEGREEHRQWVSDIAFENAEVSALANCATCFINKRVVDLGF